MQKLTPLALSALVAIVSAHGVIVIPPPRAPGAAMRAACGEAIYSSQSADNTSDVEGLLLHANSIVDKSACNLWLCKGYQFEDNKANVQSYSPGEVVPIQVKVVVVSRLAGRGDED